MHEDVKWLCKTFPWEGIFLTCLFAFLGGRSWLTGQVGFSQRRYGTETVYITLAEKPVEFYMLIAMLTVFFACALGYTVFRFAKRKEVMMADEGKSN